MKKLLTLLIACIAFCNISFAQVYGVPINHNDKLEIVKAADMVLDVNAFGTAHSALVLFGLPVNEKATEEFAKRFSKTWNEYKDYIATNAYVYWPELERSPKDLLLGRLTSYGPMSSDIKELYFILGETYRAKFIEDLSQYGYKKIKAENKKDNDLKINYLETTYQKENHLCIVKNQGSSFHASFTRKIRQESLEEKKISDQCKHFIRLHAADDVYQFDLYEKDVPYEERAIFDIQFPQENTVIDIPQKVLSDNPQPVNTTIEVDVTVYNRIKTDIYKDKEVALFNWIKPNIDVKKTARVNFPRYGKGFLYGSSFKMSIRESKEIDSCSIPLKVRFTYGSRKITLKNQKDVEKQLISVYGNADMLGQILDLVPLDEIERSIRSVSMMSTGYTCFINVHISRRKVTYSFKNKSATYMLPFVYTWSKPYKK